MKRKIFISFIFSLSLLFIGCSQNSTVPKVINAFPQNGSQNVDPSVREIWVQFDKPMMDKSWSWAYTEKDKFPQLSGDPYYSEENTKNTLPVLLEANHEYDIWINTETLKNFKDKTGISAEPFELKFKTR